jgi:hypothetical protein
MEESTGRLILQRGANGQFLIATNTHVGRTGILKGVWTHGVTYPQRLVRVTFNVPHQPSLQTIDCFRLVFWAMSSFGFIKWRKTPAEAFMAYCV